MDKSDSQTRPLHIDQMKNSAASNTGVANNYNIAGDQHQHYTAPLKPWTPPLMLPPRTQSFVGRDEDLAWLLQQLTNGAGMTLALCGPGGIGKTALTAEALSRLIAQEEWLGCFPDGIFYHSFYTYPSLDVAFEELAHIFKEELNGNPHLAARRAVSHRRALLVFDGVEGLTDTRPLRELGGKNVVLMLSRRQSDAPDQAHRRDLGVLSQEQAVTLLQALAGSRAADRLSTERLVQHIGGFPLALQLIGSYLSSRQEEIGDYLRWFEDQGLATINFGEHQHESVSVLLQRIYDALDASEQHIFMLLGLLAPAPFPLQLVQDIMELDEWAVQQALGSLVNWSVLRRFEQDYEISHPLVHAFATEYLSSQLYVTFSLSSNTITRWRERILTTLTTYFEQRDPYDSPVVPLPWTTESGSIYERCLPHALHYVFWIDQKTFVSLDDLRLFEQVSFYLRTYQRFREALPLCRRALAICEQQFGPTDPKTVVALNRLADICVNLVWPEEILKEAGSLYQRALTICEQHWDPTDPVVLFTLNHVACFSSLLLDGKQIWKGEIREEAMILHTRIIVLAKVSYKRLRSAPHSTAVIGLASLAEVFFQLRMYYHAELMSQKALAMYEQHPDAADPMNVASCLSCLASICTHLGEFKEAEEFHQRVLSICEKHQGPTHRSTMNATVNLIDAYFRQRKYLDADVLCRHTLAILEQLPVPMPHDLWQAGIHCVETIAEMQELPMDQNTQNELKAVLEQAWKAGNNTGREQALKNLE